MTSRRISAALVAITVPVGVWAVAEAHAGPANADQEEAQREPAQKEPAQEPAQKPAKDMRATLQRDMQEWMTAWDRLDPQQREVLLIAGRRVAMEVEGLTPEQKASVIRGLDALAADTTVDYRELPEKQRAAVQDAIGELRNAYLQLSADQKTRFLTELADSLDEMRQHEGPQQPM
jgi:hypothetical protein